jgi:hypothetical protein
MPSRFVDFGERRNPARSGTRQTFSAKEDMMKSLIKAVVISSALAAPIFAVAQTSTQTNNGPVTRAEVRADLIRLEQAGYRPGVASDPSYPADIQAAEAKVAASNDAFASTSVGGASAQSGAGASVQSRGSARSIYSGR